MRSYVYLVFGILITILNAQTDSVYVHLPDYIYTTTKSNYSIYYQNLIRAEFQKKENIISNCSVGYLDSMKYNLDSLQEGIYDFKLTVYDSLGSFIEKDSSKIIVTNDSVFKNDTLRIMIIGDSFTSIGIYPKYLKDLYINSTSNPIEFLGTSYNSLYPFWGIDNDIYHEGYAERSWEFFANYVESPFVYDTYGALDLNRYFNESLNHKKPDIIVIFLGICNIQILDPNSIEIIDERIDSFFTETKMQKLVNSLCEFFYDAKIGVVLIPPPNEREYTHTDPNYLERKITHHRLGQRYENFFRNYHPRISVIPVSSNIDTFFGFGELDGVHPSYSGYMQIADSIYGWLKYQITQLIYAPKNIAISYANSSANLTWQASSGASQYLVYRSEESYGNYYLIGTTSNLYFTDTNISQSNKYFYKITAENSLK